MCHKQLKPFTLNHVRKISDSMDGLNLTDNNCMWLWTCEVTSKSSQQRLDDPPCVEWQYKSLAMDPRPPALPLKINSGEVTCNKSFSILTWRQSPWTNYSRPDWLPFKGEWVREWNVVCFSQTTGEKWFRPLIQGFSFMDCVMCGGFLITYTKRPPPSPPEWKVRGGVTLFQLDWLIALIHPLLFVMQTFAKGHESQRVRGIDNKPRK